MKRRITVEQLQELTEEQQQRLREWWKPTAWDVIVVYHGMGMKVTNVYNEMVSTDKKVCMPLLSIGQMIEMLQLYKDKDIFKYHDIDITDENLCDALWSAVKQVL